MWCEEFCHKLRVLMWKHCKVRLRKLIYSTFEFVSPVVLYVIALALWLDFTAYIFAKHVPTSFSQAGNSVRPAQTYLPARLLQGGKNEILRIFYKPNSIKANTLVKMTAENLGITNGMDSNSDELYLRYWSFDTETQLMRQLNEIGTAGVAVVIFENLNDPQWPESLKYKIRMASNLTVQVSESDDFTKHSEKFGEEFEPLVSVQWAIDKAYLELNNERPVKQKRTSQHSSLKEVMNRIYATVADMLTDIMCFLTIMSPVPFFIIFVSRLVNEKTTGIKELMKMVGVSSSVLYLSHILNSMVTCAMFVIVNTLILKLPEFPIIPETSGCIIAITHFFYFIFITMLAVAWSTVICGTNLIGSLSMCLYFALYWLSSYANKHWQRGSALFIISRMLPHVPMHWFWDEVEVMMLMDEGLTFSNMFERHGRSASVAAVWLWLVWQSLVLGVIAIYVDHVRPGKFGVARPWNFCWLDMVRNNKSLKQGFSRVALRRPKIGEYFEDPPKNAKVGIQIVDVTKIFNNWLGREENVALRNIHLKIYEGEITVLVGRNGAGKTTLMNIITGMYSPTTGKVYIRGMDTSTKLVEIRKHVGLCPQHNITFSDLSVRDHLIFFAMLKGASYKKAKQNSDNLLRLLKLDDKANKLNVHLSGGMKRRLQLGCALAGGAEILILDEPTTGLDVETRRELWNLLLALRGKRTVLLTTHFMEEADALADRIAALHKGVLCCHATPMFLKKAMGTGYSLTLRIDHRYPQARAARVLLDMIPEARVREYSPIGLLMDLPSSESYRFPEMFDALEEMKEELGILSMGVGVTKFEDVFLRLSADDSGSFNEEMEAESIQRGGLYKRLHGFSLCFQQMRGLIKRQILYTLTKVKTVIIFEILIPVVFIMYYTHSTFSKAKSTKYSSMSLKNNKNYNLGGHNSRTMNERFNDMDYVNVDWVSDVRGNEFALKKRFSDFEGMDFDSPKDSFKMPVDEETCVFYFTIMAAVITFVMVSLVSLPVKELKSNMRHIHIMSGCPIWLHWGTTWLWHMVKFTLTILYAIIISLFVFDQYDTFNRAHFIVLFRCHFKCNLKDEHKTMLHYHITGVMRYSALFASMEAAKEKFPHLVEDYTISETTLEDVFLMLARQNAKPKRPSAQ